VLGRVAGFASLQRYLDDPEIEEIWVNQTGQASSQVGVSVPLVSSDAFRSVLEDVPRHHRGYLPRPVPGGRP